MVVLAVGFAVVLFLCFANSMAAFASLVLTIRIEKDEDLRLSMAKRALMLLLVWMVVGSGILLAAVAVLVSGDRVQAAGSLVVSFLIIQLGGRLAPLDQLYFPPPAPR
jgi:hypothetical protein